jgi:hypothetical protein
MKNAVFWDVAPCRSCVKRRFGGTYRLHLHGTFSSLQESEKLRLFLATGAYSIFGTIKEIRKSFRLVNNHNENDKNKELKKGERSKDKRASLLQNF